MNRRDLAILAMCCALLGVALFRLLTPREGATRRISVEAVEIKSVPIKNGESLVQEASWTSPDDVFIVGWAPRAGASAARPHLRFTTGETTIFQTQQASMESPPTLFLPAGTGFLIPKGETVKLRLQIVSSGKDGESRGARALIYFHPLAWR